MGETVDKRGVRSFHPDDTDTEFYLNSNFVSVNLGYILELAREKWGAEINIEHLQIESEYIHTDCLGYDRYDSGDYTRFLRIEYDPQ